MPECNTYDLIDVTLSHLQATHGWYSQVFRFAFESILYINAGSYASFISGTFS